MKKTISVIVALAMMLMLSIPAFAGNFDDDTKLTDQQKVYAEVIYSGLTAGNNTANTISEYVGNNLDYKADITSSSTIDADVAAAFDTVNVKLNGTTFAVTDANLLSTMKIKTAATVKGHYQAANSEGSTDVGYTGSGSAILDGLFPGFSNGDFSDMFGGFTDSFSQIGDALSGLLSGLGLGGGSSDSTATTKASTTKSSSSSNNSTSIPKTGDVALYAVAGIAVAAGIALVITKKKNNDSDEK